MNEAVNTFETALSQAAKRLDFSEALKPRGVVQRVGDGVATVVGLDEVGFEELLQFDSGALGMAYDLAENEIGVILLSNSRRVREGDGVRGLKRLPEVSVGHAVLGRIFDPMGHPLDEGPPPPARPTYPLFRAAPEIIQRKSVDETLFTGILAVDAAIPIGRGQRELIIGDRNVGKTALAIDMVAAQQANDVACVYVIIGQPMSRVLTLRSVLEKAGCIYNTVIIAADASSSPGMQYLAPYAGSSVAEWFRDQGQHALVVYDDLTKHADAYRELALLLGRSPGREAFPGDIFYVHAELLERASARHQDLGGGSVTALPIVETNDGDISSYIPTNLISITDGQIYLDSGRFERNLRPAIDIGRSVSRIGGVAQSRVMRAVAKSLKITISRFESLESLTRVGLEMDVAMQETIRRGNMLRGLLRQKRLEHRSLMEQIVTLMVVSEDWADGVPSKEVRAFIHELISIAKHELGDAFMEEGDGQTDVDCKRRLAEIAREIRPRFQETAA